MRKAPRKFSTILFKGGNTPLKMRASFFLPRTPDFYLCPKIPGGQGSPWDNQGGQEDYCPPMYATGHLYIQIILHMGFTKHRY